jgi:hypothetical protein
MSVTVIVHITNEDAIMGEVDELPTPTDQFITVRHPSRKDGKDLHYLEDEVSTMMIPWHRINFVEVMPSEDELEEVITFVREQ